MVALFLGLLLIVQCIPALTWNLSYYIPVDVPIGQVVVWRNRAFLCVPRHKPGIVKATLMEVPWPDSVKTLQRSMQQQAGATAFPGGLLALQKEGYCPALQNVTALDVDSMRGRLWVLDSGSAICWPKVVVYDLRKNDEMWRIELRNVSSRTLTSIIADPVVGTWGPRAYVGSRVSEALIVVGMKEWWPALLEMKKPKAADVSLTHAVISETMALSRREAILYLTASDSDLMFALNLAAIRSSGPPAQNVTRKQMVTFVGFKLGPSRGLVMDLWSGLHYFLARDHAAVRWDTRRPLAAESHSVLIQSANILPTITDLFLGPQYQVWAVVGHHCVRIQKYSFM